MTDPLPDVAVRQDAGARARRVLPATRMRWIACWLARGFVGALAILRRRGRTVLVFLTTLPGLFVLAFVLGELLLPTERAARAPRPSQDPMP